MPLVPQMQGDAPEGAPLKGWVDAPNYRGQPGQTGMMSQMSGAVVADAPGTPPTRITEAIRAAANGKVKAN